MHHSSRGYSIEELIEHIIEEDGVDVLPIYISSIIYRRDIIFNLIDISSEWRRAILEVLS